MKTDRKHLGMPPVRSVVFDDGSALHVYRQDRFTYPFAVVQEDKQRVSGCALAHEDEYDDATNDLLPEAIDVLVPTDELLTHREMCHLVLLVHLLVVEELAGDDG